MKTCEPRAGEDVSETAKRIVSMADESGERVEASFNEILLFAEPGTSPGDVVARYERETNRRHEEYINSQEYKDRQAAMEREQQTKERKLKAALDIAPKEMSLRDADGWRLVVEKYTDAYGAATVQYAERWARLMELRIADGNTLVACAEETSHLANNEGITGFMYGCAVSILAKVWTHGEELRRWNNLKTQIGNEGERANESGGVLNPALLNFG